MGVVDAVRVSDVRANRVPRAVVVLGQFAHRGDLLLWGVGEAVLTLLDQIRIQGVRPGGTVTSDVARTVVDQIGAGDVVRPIRVDPPNAHPDWLRGDVDAKLPASLGTHPV